ELVVREIPVRWETNAKLFVDAREFEGFRVQHYRKLRGGQSTEQFLALSQAVTKQHGRHPIGQGFLTKMRDVPQDFFGWRKNIVRPAEGCLHDEIVGLRCGAWFRRKTAAQFEVAGVKQAT